MATSFPTFTGQPASGTVPTLPEGEGFERLMNRPNEAELERSYRQDVDSAEMRRRLDDYDKQSNAFLPQFLAWGTALRTGNAGPLLQLQEQKRVTALSQATFPDMMKIRALTQAGKYDEAWDLTNQLSQAAVTRAPELGKMYTQLGEKILDRKQKLDSQELYYKVTSAQADQNEKNNPGTEDPRRNALKALKAFIDKGKVADQAIMSNLGVDLRPHVQEFGGQLATTAGGVTAFAPLTQAVSANQVHTTTGMMLAAAHGMNTTDLRNLLNGVAVKVGDKTITPDSPEAQGIRGEFSRLLLPEAQMEMAKLVPVEPQLVTQMLGVGVPSMAIATREFGGQKGAQDVVQTILGRQHQREMETSLAHGLGATQAQLASPYGSAQVGQAVINRQTGEVRYQMPSAEITGAWKPIPLKNIDQATNIHSTMQTLADMTALLRGLGDINTKFGQMEKGFNDRIAALTGMTFDPNTVKREAARVMIYQAIENAANDNPSINKVEVGNLKDYIAGKMSSTQDLLEGMKVVQQRLLRKMMGAIGVAPAKGPQEIVQEVIQQQEQYKPQSPLSTYTPKGGRPAAPTKGDVEGAMQQYGIPPAAAPPAAAPAVPTPPQAAPAPPGIRPGLKPNGGKP